jgi:predicted DNA-binding WGR domain protein
MYLRLEKIDPDRNRWRWYVLSVQQTLFGEWALIREWGRIGHDGGQSAAVLYTSERDALSACDTLKALKTRRGYAAQAEQLDLPLWG